MFLGVATAAATAVLWFRLAPELMQQKGLGPETLSSLGSVVMHPGFQVVALMVGAVALSAGVATRTASRQDKATWTLAAGSVWLFGCLLLSVNALYDPVFMSPEDLADVGADDDWED